MTDRHPKQPLVKKPAKRAAKTPVKKERHKQKTGPKTHEITPYFEHVAPLPSWLNP